MANIICIVCPKGCRLTVDENTLAVTGNGCPRGAEYGKNELTHQRSKKAPAVRRGLFYCAGELYYQVQHFRGTKRSPYRTLVE